MDYKEFTYIQKIAELQNVTKAANELYISQPSLSYYLSKIEGQLGVELFNRNTNPISLTLAGEKYIEKGKQIIALNEELKQELMDISKMKKGRITIGIPRSRAYYMLPNILPEFREKYPYIELDLVETKSENIEDFLIKGKVDFVLMALPVKNKLNDEHLDYQIINQEELVLVTKRGMLSQDQYDKDGIVNFKKIKDIPFILLGKGHGIRYAVDELFENHKYDPNVVLETTSNITAFRLASTGMAAAIVPEMMKNLFLPMDEVEYFSLSKDELKWDVAVVFRKNDPMNEVEKYFFELAKNNYKKLYK
jgi:DNA-binding transcriptional LysR family regulator